jgi:hypothetical protein
MKAALEGRQPAAAAPLRTDQMIAVLLCLRMHEPVQRERLAVVLEALRNVEPRLAIG